MSESKSGLDRVQIENEELLATLDLIRRSIKEMEKKYLSTDESADDSHFPDFDDTYEMITDSATGRMNIEYIDFSEWGSLPFIPEAVFRLGTVQSLHLQKCHSLGAVSSSIQNLRQLTELDLSRCTKLKSIPNEICTSLLQLRRLTLTSCTEIEHLPKDWTGMSNLTSLYLEGCYNLREIPESLWEECGNLVYLGLVRLTCLNPCVPDGIQNLRKLKTLNVRNCPILKRISNDPSRTLGALKEIHSIFASGSPLEELPVDVLASLRHLQVVSLEDCPNIPALFKDKKKNNVSLMRLLVRTRNQAALLELGLWKAWGWSDTAEERARNRIACDGIDTVIHGVLPFLCGENVPRLFSFCYNSS